MHNGKGAGREVECCRDAVGVVETDLGWALVHASGWHAVASPRCEVVTAAVGGPCCGVVYLVSARGRLHAARVVLLHGGPCRDVAAATVGVSLKGRAVPWRPRWSGRCRYMLHGGSCGD